MEAGLNADEIVKTAKQMLAEPALWEPSAI
jgi:hypothetical protein